MRAYKLNRRFYMNYEQAQSEVEFFDCHCTYWSLSYSKLSKEAKIELMLEAGQKLADKLKQASTAQVARLLLGKEYDELIYMSNFRV